MPRSIFDRRSLLLIAAGGVILVVGVLQVENLAADRELLKPYDFVEYWSAGRQLLDGRDPYDPDELIVMQREMFAGHRKTVMMWNPPWTLPLTLPFAALPWRPAQFLWMALQLAAVLVGADLFWRLFGGDPGRRWISWLAALSFAPTLFLLLMGQISGLLLLGLAGFLYFLKDDRRVAAGCCAALGAIKPHLLSLFALALLLEAVRERPIRRVIVTGGITLVVAGLLPLLWNPHVWDQYFAAMRRPPSENFDTMQEFEQPTPGYYLRQMIPGAPFRAQFIPLGLGILATFGYWLARRQSWQWEKVLPPLVLVSVLTAAYGAWAFDLVLLLVPIMPMAVWLSRSPNQLFIGLLVAAYLTLNGIVLTTIRQAGSQSNPWIAPAVLLAYLAFLWPTGKSPEFRS